MIPDDMEAEQLGKFEQKMTGKEPLQGVLLVQGLEHSFSVDQHSNVSNSETRARREPLGRPLIQLALSQLLRT
jgi:hypothetical protein